MFSTWTAFGHLRIACFPGTERLWHRYHRGTANLLCFDSPAIGVYTFIQMNRLFVSCCFVAVLSFAVQAQTAKRSVEPPRPAPPPFNVVEASISEMRAALDSGRVTSRELVVQYLTR